MWCLGRLTDKDKDKGRDLSTGSSSGDRQMRIRGRDLSICIGLTTSGGGGGGGAAEGGRSRPWGHEGESGKGTLSELSLGEIGKQTSVHEVVEGKGEEMSQ